MVQVQKALEDLKVHTVTEVAEVLRVSKMTVYRLVKSGELESIRIGRSFRIKEASLVAYLKKVTGGGDSAGDGDA